MTSPLPPYILDLEVYRLGEPPVTPEIFREGGDIQDLPEFVGMSMDTFHHITASSGPGLDQIIEQDPNPDKTHAGATSESETNSLPEFDVAFRGFRRFNRTHDRERDQSFENPRECRGIYRKSRPRAPVKSCGVLCFQDEGLKEQDLRVLMVRRKDSLAFVEFLRGKYKPSDPMYVRTLLRGMTRTEHMKIQSMEFEELWVDMWKSRPSRNHLQEYQKSRGRFEECKEEVRRFLTENPDVGETEPEWTFPKGRPNRGEDSMICALREFYEESNIPTDQILLINHDEPLVETYTGTNGIVYQNIFFIAKTKTIDISLHPDNQYQSREISGIEWVTPEDGMARMRHTYPSREQILREAVHRILMEKE